MNTQNAPVHIRLWHREFWMMVVANLLLSASVTLLIPTLPQWLLYEDGLSAEETGGAMGAFALGLFLLGGLCSFLVQRYRRNMVCVWAIAFLALTVVLPVYWHPVPFGYVVLLRLLQGAAFGLASQVFSSTLIIDTCESFQRTEANHSVTWFGRFALSIGPMAGLLLYGLGGYRVVAFVSLGCMAVAVLLILLVHFPFRVPADQLHVWSLDRFFLPQGWPLFVNLLLITVAAGMLLSLPLDAHFYALLMIGFLLALLAQRFVFRDAELKSEVVSGLLLMASAQLIMIFSPQSPLLSPLLGLGLGIVGARFLLFFIKLSHHCQRGTAQSTFLLAWESGLALGLGLGYGLFDGRHDALKHWSVLLVIVAWTLYNFCLHNWFVKHKNR